MGKKGFLQACALLLLLLLLSSPGAGAFAPEILRVVGKRRPDFVRPYLEQLELISETDSNRVVRIHCQSAVKAAKIGGKSKEKQVW